MKTWRLLFVLLLASIAFSRNAGANTAASTKSPSSSTSTDKKNERPTSELQILMRETKSVLKEAAEIWEDYQKTDARWNELFEGHRRLQDQVTQNNEKIESLIDEHSKSSLAQFIEGIKSNQEKILHLYEIVERKEQMKKETNMNVEEDSAPLGTWKEDESFSSKFDSILNMIVNETMDSIAEYDTLSQNDSYGNDCASREGAQQLIQSSIDTFQQNQLGLFDLAEKHGRIIHSLTSKTYDPKTPLHTLGDWSRFIPEDWEAYLLPSGWEEWSLDLPSSVSHTLGLSSNVVAPPESILDRQYLPGSCWPMEGSQGHVTIGLDVPVEIEAFSVENTVSELLEDPEGQLSSAPKKLRFVGFPACETDCQGLSFDPSVEISLLEVEYDLESDRVQTFRLKDNQECNPSFCEAPQRIGGVRMEVLGNYGNSDYTCIYRVRIHGETR